MSSKLDPFFMILFEMLNRQGLSYRAVCAHLIGEEIHISPQALRSWHLRRSRKLVVRAQNLPAGHSFHPDKSLIGNSSGGKTTQSKPFSGGEIQTEIHPVNSANELKLQILEEERRLAAGMPFSQKNYLIQRKKNNQHTVKEENQTYK